MRWLRKMNPYVVGPRWNFVKRIGFLCEDRNLIPTDSA
jgi:hypothetical protein